VTRVKYLRWFVVVLLMLVLADFAVSNLDAVRVELWPLPPRDDFRLYAVVLVAALIGFLAGEFVAWTGGRRWRQEARRKTRRIEALERELAATQAQMKPATGTAVAAARMPVPGLPRG
jgi:uncharacterized integral membrane protein